MAALEDRVGALEEQIPKLATLQNDIKQVKDVVDLTWANVEQILETLETLPTKDEVNARFDEVLKAIYAVSQAVKEHTHGP
jgi:hypothetical protein